MSMPLKDFLVKKLSQKLNVPERIIDVVITDQFTSAFRATSTHNSIELSGLGKFIFNQKKAHRQMASYETSKTTLNNLMAQNPSEKETKTLELKMETINKNIEHLKPKLRNQ